MLTSSCSQQTGSLCRQQRNVQYSFRSETYEEKRRTTTKASIRKLVIAQDACRLTDLDNMVDDAKVITSLVLVLS